MFQTHNAFQQFIQRMNLHYEREFITEEAAYQDNQKIKSDLLKAILAHQHQMNIDAVRQGLELLFEHTGCVEDQKILAELLQPHLSNGTLDHVIVGQASRHSASGRWR
ncbi:hypothetical protein [Chitinimonas sp. JJ19]|uniref:hypothetical protein n=1 Tax=Chitinimonas sp. JJ19 TaxID=3109352 RepID=UPI0030013C5E